MLTERDQRLLTAAVDGTLTPAQSQKLDQLLDRSSQARDLLKKMQSDAQRLRQLPRQTSPIDFVGPVLATIQQAQPTPAIRTLPSRRMPTQPRFVPLAVAASICLAITLGTAALLSLDRPDRAIHSQHRRPQTRPSVQSMPTRPSTEPSPVEGWPEPAKPTPTDVPIAKHQPAQPTEPREPTATEPTPKPAPSDHLTAPISQLPAEAFEMVKLRLPTLGSIRQLDQTQLKSRVEAEIRSSDTARLELFTRNPTRAIERLQVLLRNQGIKLIVEPFAQDALKKKHVGDYAVLTEHLTQVELLKLLNQLSADERQAEKTGKASEAGWEDFLLRMLTPTDLRELARTLGVEPSRLRSVPLADPNRAISDATISQVVDSLTNPAPTDPKQAKSNAERLALIYLPAPMLRANLQPGAAAYFEARGPRRPETLLVSIIVRRLM